MDAEIKLEKALDKYYKAHQISKNNNLIDMFLNKTYFTKKDELDCSIKCINKIFDVINEKWPQQALSSSSHSEKCFYTRKFLENQFGSSAQECNGKCYKCYNFCIQRYFKNGGGIKLRVPTQRLKKKF